jgi:hypothetical protein
VHTAAADQAQQMQRASARLDATACLDEGVVLEERSVLDGLRDADEVLHHDASGPQVEVPDLAVAHLPFR